jgi:beta-alanine--pyruvate transaminase
VPIGGVIVSAEVYDAFMQGPEAVTELMHGYTYSGHPLACAAAIATIDVYEEQDIFANCARVSKRWEEQAHSLKGEPHVVDVRNIGLLAAIDLAPKADAPGSRGKAAAAGCYEAGVLIRSPGDVLVLSPPLIIADSEIDRIFETIRTALRALD